ncbi:MAG TPA: DUF6484 domain-containing protein [Vicinamibacterales bacterium]|nr:DUF6484 domain-containing protein [Vicinamibacterales bacterium]
MTNDRDAARLVVDIAADVADDDLTRLLAGPVDATGPSSDGSPIHGIVVGTLVGFAGGGAVPLVMFPQQRRTAAVAARATVAVHAEQIGREIVLMFEDGDPQRPIIMGWLRTEKGSTLPPAPEQVEVDADGERLVVSATDRIVLRCGKASITLTKEGKVVIQGAYVSNQSSGVLRLNGGSVQIN